MKVEVTKCDRCKSIIQGSPWMIRFIGQHDRWIDHTCELCRSCYGQVLRSAGISFPETEEEIRKAYGK